MTGKTVQMLQTRQKVFQIIWKCLNVPKGHKMSNSDAWLSERTCFPFILFLCFFLFHLALASTSFSCSHQTEMGHVRFCALLYYVPISYATFPRTLLRLQLITTFAPNRYVCTHITTFAPRHYICMCIVTFPF